MGLHDGIAYAIERFVKSQVGINAGADERGVRERPDHTLSARVGAIGHHGRDANVVVSASQQQ